MNRLKLTFPMNDFTRLILINLKLQKVDFDVAVTSHRLDNPSSVNLAGAGRLGSAFSLSICRESLKRCGIDEVFLKSLYLESTGRGSHYSSVLGDISDNPDYTPLRIQDITMLSSELSNREKIALALYCFRLVCERVKFVGIAPYNTVKAVKKYLMFPNESNVERCAIAVNKHYHDCKHKAGDVAAYAALIVVNVDQADTYIRDSLNECEKIDSSLLVPIKKFVDLIKELKA